MVNGRPAFVEYYCNAATSPICTLDQVNILTPLDNTTGPVQVVVTSVIGSSASSPSGCNLPRPLSCFSTWRDQSRRRIPITHSPAQPPYIRGIDSRQTRRVNRDVRGRIRPADNTVDEWFGHAIRKHAIYPVMPGGRRQRERRNRADRFGSLSDGSLEEIVGAIGFGQLAK